METETLLTPPERARAEAREALAQRDSLGYGGSEADAEFARRLAGGADLSAGDARRLLGFFERHAREVDLATPAHQPDEQPAPLDVAYRLRGGDPMRLWLASEAGDVDLSRYGMDFSAAGAGIAVNAGDVVACDTVEGRQIGLVRWVVAEGLTGPDPARGATENVISAHPRDPAVVMELARKDAEGSWEMTGRRVARKVRTVELLKSAVDLCQEISAVGSYATLVSDEKGVLSVMPTATPSVPPVHRPGPKPADSDVLSMLSAYSMSRDTDQYADQYADTGENNTSVVSREFLEGLIEWQPTAEQLDMTARSRGWVEPSVAKRMLNMGFPDWAVGAGNSGSQPTSSDLSAGGAPGGTHDNIHDVSPNGAERVDFRASPSSAVYPGLERKAGKSNWVDAVGGLPSYIERIAKHLHYEEGYEIGRSIAVAVNHAKRMCASGDTNLPGAGPVNPKSRAEACKAVAEWEGKKAKAHSMSRKEGVDEDGLPVDFGDSYHLPEPNVSDL